MRAKRGGIGRLGEQCLLSGKLKLNCEDKTQCLQPLPHLTALTKVTESETELFLKAKLVVKQGRRTSVLTCQGTTTCMSLAGLVKRKP